MAVDEELSKRLRDYLEGLEGVSEKKMFGGVCFMVNGHMVGVASASKADGRNFLFRIGKGREEDAATLGAAGPMVQGGRRMSGFYWVDADELSDEAFRGWMSLALENAFSLPIKE